MTTTIRCTTTVRHAVAAAAALAVAGSLFAVPSVALATASTSGVMAATTASRHPLLRQGSTGAAVREWQSVAASVLGENRIAVDGVFGPQTSSATREVQKMFGLVPDGIVGPRTWAATAVVHAPVDPVIVDGTVASVGHLELGDRGDRVAQWQRLLDADPRSTTATAVDGIFGPATHASTRAFQSRYGLVPDGVVGPSTRATMQEVRDDI